MDVEVPILSGYLNVPSQSGFPLHRISKKVELPKFELTVKTAYIRRFSFINKSCQKFCLLFKSSRYGIERLEICESKEDKNSKIVTLENCVKITQEPYPANLIYIVKKTGTLTLNALNEDSLKEWVNALQIVAFRSKNDTTLTQSAIEEDNDLYCSSYGDGLFIVTLIPSEASIRCNIEPKVYMLHLTATDLQLKATSDLSNVISNWPYRFIRKYGYRNGKFTFEAGRKCYTGEGVFTLDHSNPQEVFRCMSSKMKSMKKMISGDVKTDSSENQLHVAASMEAGSRSPLPPSSSNQNIIEFEINSNQSTSSVRNIMPICESFSGVGVIINAKNIPNKPPRKINAIEKLSLPLQLLSSDKHLYEEKCLKYNSEAVSITSSSDPNKTAGSLVILKPSSSDIYKYSQEIENSIPKLPARNDFKYERDYESIETITDAWKTLGINDVKHNENVNTTDLNDIIWDRNNPKSISTTKVINIDIGECGRSHLNTKISDITYDRLDFLSANHKTSNGYKTIVTVAPLSNKNIAYKTSQNDYELINVPVTDSNRKIDENYLECGHIYHSQIMSSSTRECESLNDKTKNITINDNKTNTLKNANATSNENINNKDIGLNYAVVSKAKRM